MSHSDSVYHARGLMMCAARIAAICAAIIMVPMAAGAQPGPGQPAKPLFKDFMGINGHFTFKPDLYRQVCGLARNYHNMSWDVKRPGDAITLPVCVNRVDWIRDVYGRWKKSGFETDICVQFGEFGPKAADYQKMWAGRESWCYDYGKAMARCFGPAAGRKLCTSIEIGNEPGSKFDPKLYKMIFLNMARGIRDGDPAIKILTPAVSARDGDEYIQDVRGIYAGAEVLPFYDVINVHTYATVERKDWSESPWNRSYPEDPEIAYLKVVDEVIAWRDEHAPGKEVWVTEFGYDACTPEAMARRSDWFLKLDWRGNTELQQAQYLVRSLLAFAERDVQRAYIYYFDDDDSPSMHGSSGLTRKFVPKMSFFAVRQLYRLIGEYRFHSIVRKVPGELCVYEFRHGSQPGKIIWVAWSPTGARTNAKEGRIARTARVSLENLPGSIELVIGMSTADEAGPRVNWQKSEESGITLEVGESPVYILMGDKPTDAARSN